MLRLRILFKSIPRSFSTLTPKNGIERAVIDMKFSRSQDLGSFLKEIDIAKASASQLAYTLKLALKISRKSHLEPDEVRENYYKIIAEAENKISKLDATGIVDFCEWLANVHLFKKRFLSKQKKQILISRIVELISSHSFNRKQIMLIYELLPAQGFYIKELEDEIVNIADNPASLNLEEISQIFTGNDRYMFSRDNNLFKNCMNRIIQLSYIEDLNEEHLAKIMKMLALEEDSQKNRRLIEQFLKIVEKTLPRWKENDLLSILKFCKTHFKIGKNLQYHTVERIDRLLGNSQPIDFYIEIVSLLKDEAKNALVFDRVISNSMKAINSKMYSESLNEEIIRKVLEIMKPNIDMQTAKLLVAQINRHKFMFSTGFDAFRKASYITTNDNGKVVPLVNLIPIEKFIQLDDKKIEAIWGANKIEILDSIFNTRNYEAHGLDRISSIIIRSVADWALESDENVIRICEVITHVKYNPKLIKALKPVQSTVYKALARNIKNGFSLYYSMNLYEADPETWKLFFNKYKNIFSIQNVSDAIKYFQGPFEAIIYLLSAYENNLSPLWIGLAMLKITDIASASTWNDFLAIMNKLDPYDFLNEKNLYKKSEFYYNLNNMKLNFSLITDLISGAYKLVRDLPVNSLFEKNNFKVLDYAARLGILEPKVADKVLSHYDYAGESDYWALLIISLKCSDPINIETILYNLFHQNMEMNLLRTVIKRYLSFPKNEVIENFIIDFFKTFIPKLKEDRIHKLLPILYTVSEMNKNDHNELLSIISTLTKELILKNIGLLEFTDFIALLDLTGKNLPINFDFSYIIYKNQSVSKSQNSEKSRGMLIEKIKEVGFSDKKVVQTVCNKQDNFSSAYLSGTLSCLADLRFEQESWAIETANSLIDYTQNKGIVFESDWEYINWLYGLVVFNANKSIILRHAENSKYFYWKLPSFKHFLLANHFQTDPDLREIFEEKINRYQVKHDYFKTFGITQPLIDDIKSSFNKANLEIKTGEFINGIWAPFYIPSLNSALWPVTNSVLLFKSNLFRGEFNMHHNHLLKQVNDLIVMSKEDTSKLGDLDIRNYLKI